MPHRHASGIMGKMGSRFLRAGEIELYDIRVLFGIRGVTSFRKVKYFLSGS
jgi:hypothetical protein